MKYAKVNELLVRFLLYDLIVLRYLKEDMCIFIKNSCFGIKVIINVSQEKEGQRSTCGMKWKHLGDGIQLAIDIN